MAAQHKGSIHRPLTSIPLHCVILDELHVLLRIFDVMLLNLIMIMKLMDDRLRLHTNLHLHQLVACIKSCGVSFNVWESELSSGNFAWTSLTGESVKKVLKLHMHTMNIASHHLLLTLATSAKNESYPSAKCIAANYC